MKLNKLILKAINEGIEKSLMQFDDSELEFGKSNLSKIADKKVKDNIWLFDNTVDLNLPSGTLWCKYNLGATCEDTKESWYGNHYAWGELEPKTEYTEENYTYKDTSDILPLENDAVYLTNNLLRMPTREQIEELVNYTTSKWVENYNGIDGLNGRIFTSKTNDNSIFIPAAGYYYDIWDLDDTGDSCRLWSSSLISNDPYPYYTYYLDFNSNGINVSICHYYYGLSVRGVSI